MRDLESGRIYDEGAKQKDIDVDQARPFGYYVLPPHVALDLLDAIQKLQREEGRLDLDDKVQKPGLIAHILRFRLVK